MTMPCASGSTIISSSSLKPSGSTIPRSKPVLDEFGVIGLPTVVVLHPNPSASSNQTRAGKSLNTVNN